MVDEVLEILELLVLEMTAPAGVVVGVILKLAVRLEFALMVKLQFAVPVQAPVQPENVEPEAAVAERLTAVPLCRVLEQVLPQLMPLPVTVPVPVPFLLTERV